MMDRDDPDARRCDSLTSVSNALFELRDAFLELSLALKDLQFDTDMEKREEVAKSFTTLLQKIK
jgi:hypothetical protein